MENRADRQTAWAMSLVLVEQFISSFKSAPRQLILDFDATDDRVHGDQVGRFFHGLLLAIGVFCRSMFFVETNSW